MIPKLRYTSYVWFVEVRLLWWVFYLGITDQKLSDLLELLPKPNWFAKVYWVERFTWNNGGPKLVSGKSVNGTRLLTQYWLFKLLCWVSKREWKLSLRARVIAFFEEKRQWLCRRLCG